jgi:threonine dehydrogenase-like Zn-dependent dehydrogenase
VHTFDMKAVAVRQARRKVELVERRPPTLESSTAVRLRVLEVGVCGTDAEICRFDYGGSPPPGTDELIVGHEALAQVEETGASVSTLKPGDLVVPMVRRPCPLPECPACRSGHPDFCVTGKYTERGIVGADGFLAEEVVEDQKYLVQAPAELRGIGVLTEPLTVAEKALRQFLLVRRRLPWLADASDAELMEGKHALVLGAGPVGLLGCMLLRLRGFAVTVYSRAPSPNPRAAIAERVGATYLSSEQVPLAQVAERVGGIDFVYEATGASQLAFDMLEYLASNGVFVFTGVPGRKYRIEIAGDALMRHLVLRNLTVLGTVNADRVDFDSAVRDLRSARQAWPGGPEALITGRYSMEQFCERALAKDKIKSVIAVAGS